MSENQMTLLNEEKAVSVQQDQPDIMQAIMQLSKDESFDAEKMRVLVDMKNSHEDREAKRAYNQALIDFKRNPPKIIKNKKGHNSSYASIDSVCRQLDQPLYDLGLSFRWRIETNESKVRVTCILAHVDGYSEESTMEQVADTSGNKNNLQGMGSTVTYLKRYTLLAALGLAEQGEDDDGMKALQKKNISDNQIKEVENLIEQAGAELPQVCKYFKIGALHEMTLDQYGIAVNMLQSKIKVKK